jgi:hypothetical protein
MIGFLNWGGECLQRGTPWVVILDRMHFVFKGFIECNWIKSRSQWPRGLRRGSAAVRLLVLRVRIPSEAWMSVSRECCVLSGRGPCDGLIIRPEESYRVWCVSECDCKASTMRRPWPTRGCCAMEEKLNKIPASILLNTVQPAYNISLCDTSSMA